MFREVKGRWKFRMEAVKWVVAKLQGDKLLRSAGKWVVAKLQGDKSAPQSSMELYDPWISGPLRVYRSCSLRFRQSVPSLARPSVILKVSCFGGVFHDHRGVPWEASPAHVWRWHLFTRSHTQHNKGKQGSFSWKAPRNVPGDNRILLLLCKGSTPRTNWAVIWGVQNVWGGGGKRARERALPKLFWTPPKELLVCSVVAFCTRKTEHWHLRGVENVPYEGGESKTPFFTRPQLGLFFVLRFVGSRGFGARFLLKNLLMPLFLMGCFPVDFQEVKRPLRTKSVKRPIKVGKQPINEGKRPIKAKVLVGVSVGCLMGCFRAPPAMAENGPSKKAH